MRSIEHPTFGRISLAVPGTTNLSLRFGPTTVRFDVNLPHDVSAERLHDILDRGASLEVLDAAARASARLALDDPTSSPSLYIEHHLSELPPAELSALFGTLDRLEVTPAKFLDRMQLIRVGLYPLNATRPILADYSVDPARTQYVLSFAFDPAGVVVAIDLES